jgi:hypothetical protein
MTDRDTFAAAAMTGLLLDGNEAQVPASHIADCAYNLADAMLVRRGKAVQDNCVPGNNPEIGCPPTPSESEREAIKQMLDEASGKACAESWVPDILRNLLERLK